MNILRKIKRLFSRDSDQTTEKTGQTTEPVSRGIQPNLPREDSEFDSTGDNVDPYIKKEQSTDEATTGDEGWSRKQDQGGFNESRRGNGRW